MTTKSQSTRYIQVAVPVPLDQVFDYALKPEMQACVGARVMVQFGPRKLCAIVVAVNTSPSVAISKIRPIASLVDSTALFTAADLKLANWCSRYYFYPLGETLAAMLPTKLRRGAKLDEFCPRRWQLTQLGTHTEQSQSRFSTAQRKALAQLNLRSQGLSEDILTGLGVRTTTLQSLAKQQLVLCHESTQTQPDPTAPHPTKPSLTIRATHAKLTPQQQQAIVAIENEARVHLLFGVTGSGKTEVYLQLMSKCLHRNQQVLLLVPEIGLTPQTVQRFSQRFNRSIAVLHSQQTDQQRSRSWFDAYTGQADIIVGTRSAIFSSLPRLGLIIIDEEHDSSYKQQDKMRYCARDIAILRGSWLQISVVLGSATPSLETLHNAAQKGWPTHQLTQRASGVRPPTLALIDMRLESHTNGLSKPAERAMTQTLANNQQVLVFLNRRGFAPAVICNDCGWVANCLRCDAKLTLHQGQSQLRCHHCDQRTQIPKRCPECGSSHINPHGRGTERLEEVLKAQFEVPIIRIDRDSTPTQRQFDQHLTQIRTGKPMILLGTQMLAKGHDFLDLHLVIVIDIDNGLFSSDFRAEERTSALLNQVAGRAGRGTQPGQVLVQTYQHNHQVFQNWLQNDYLSTAKTLLADRYAAHLPPFSHHILVRAESSKAKQSQHFLEQVKFVLESAHNDSNTVFILGPVNASMERRAGVYRYQLLLQAQQRSSLHGLLRTCAESIRLLPDASRVRWYYEVDPRDF